MIYRNAWEVFECGSDEKIVAASTDNGGIGVEPWDYRITVKG